MDDENDVVGIANMNGVNEDMEGRFVHEVWADWTDSTDFWHDMICTSSDFLDMYIGHAFLFECDIVDAFYFLML